MTKITFFRSRNWKNGSIGKRYQDSMLSMHAYGA